MKLRVLYEDVAQLSEIITDIWTGGEVWDSGNSVMARFAGRIIRFTFIEAGDRSFASHFGIPLTVPMVMVEFKQDPYAQKPERAQSKGDVGYFTAKTVQDGTITALRLFAKTLDAFKRAGYGVIYTTAGQRDAVYGRALSKAGFEQQVPGFWV